MNFHRGCLPVLSTFDHLGCCQDRFASTVHTALRFLQILAWISSTQLYNNTVFDFDHLMTPTTHCWAGESPFNYRDLEYVVLGCLVVTLCHSYSYKTPLVGQTLIGGTLAHLRPGTEHCKYRHPGDFSWRHVSRCIWAGGSPQKPCFMTYVIMGGNACPHHPMTSAAT